MTILGRLTHDLEIAVFRVVQESLANIHRQCGRTSGVGIGAMRERVRELGGTFEIDSNGDGTCVRVRLPLDTAKGMQLAS